MITGDALEAVPLFHDLPDTERDTVASHSADIHLHTDDWLQHEGESPSFYVLLDGKLSVLKTVSGKELLIHTHEPGDFFGEVPLLLGSPAISSVQATVPSRVMRLGATEFHELMAVCKKLNGQILRVMASRVDLLRDIAVDTRPTSLAVTGPRLDPTCHSLRDFLVRNHIPYHWTEPTAPPPEATRWPLVEVGGSSLSCPPLREVANRVGLQTAPKRQEYDVVVVGGGPAGLAAAVYGASEGLSTCLIERVAPGGQAGTSSRIENYLGFPAGVSGDDLSLRARDQAARFGAELLVTRTAMAIDSSSRGHHRVTMDGDATIETRAVILAAGVEWRTLELPGAEGFLGRGIFYGAATMEAQAVRGRDVYLVGGGNSAGQAAMLFSDYASSVTLLVRGPKVADSMSQYLINQLAAKDNVAIETDTEVTGVRGDNALTGLTTRNRVTGQTVERDCAALFIFIGAEPTTEWLPSSVLRDQWKFVCTGRDVVDLLDGWGRERWGLERDPYLLETSTPGIFAAGDVRHGSIKRVASAVGEGSMAIAFVHQYLAELTSSR